MRDQVTRHLERARLAARVAVIGTVTDVRTTVTALARTMEKIHHHRAIAIDIVTSKTRVIDSILSFTSATVGTETKTYAYYLARAVCPHAPSVLTLWCTICIFSVLPGKSRYISCFSRRTGTELLAESSEGRLSTSDS